MSSLTNPAPTDPAEAPWLKVSADVVSDATNTLRWAEEFVREGGGISLETQLRLIKELAYVRHRLEMAANSQMQPAQWRKPMAAE